MRKKDRNYYRFAKKKEKQNKRIQILASYVHVPQAKSYLITNLPLLLQNSFFAISQENLPKTSPNKSECWKKCVFCYISLVMAEGLNHCIIMLKCFCIDFIFQNFVFFNTVVIFLEFGSKNIDLFLLWFLTNTCGKLLAVYPPS